MEFSIIGYLFFGILLGISVFLPVSASGNEYLYTLLLGMQDYTPLLRLLVHAGCLTALVLHCGKRLLYIQRQLRIAALPAKRRKRQPDMVAVSDGRLLHSALLPMVISMLLSAFVWRSVGCLPLVILLMALCGVLVYIPQHYPAGNRESRGVSQLDGWILGVCSGICGLPGLSGIGLCVSAGLLRGFDREYILNISLQLSVFTLLAMTVMDAVTFLAAGFTGITLLVVIISLVAAALAFVGAYAGIMLVRYLAVRAGFSGFAYFTWGTAMLSFILYLIT